MEKEKRLGIVGIVIEDLTQANKVNDIIHDFSGLVVARMGIPYKERNVSVISLLVDGENENISALTGKLGALPKVTAKSMLHKM